MTEDSADRTTLTLTLTEDATTNQFLVNQLELQGPTMRHRVQPSRTDRTIRAVLTDDAAAFIETLIAKQDGSTGVYSDPTVVFRSEALTLQGVHILGSLTQEDERRKLVMRFLTVNGDAQSLVRDRVSAARAESRAIAMEAIERVVGRTYDAARVYDLYRGFSEPPAQFNGYGRDVMSKRAELLFRLDLLQRAVADVPPPPGPDRDDPKYLNA